MFNGTNGKLKLIFSELKFINKRRRYTKNVFPEVFFYLKDFLFYKYIYKMYILADGSFQAK